MDFFKTEEYTYVTDYFIILSVCHVFPFCFKKKIPHCKACYHGTSMKTKSAYLFSKIFFKAFIRLLHKMLDSALCLFFLSFPSAEKICVKYN